MNENHAENQVQNKIHHYGVSLQNTGASQNARIPLQEIRGVENSSRPIHVDTYAAIPVDDRKRRRENDSVISSKQASVSPNVLLLGYSANTDETYTHFLSAGSNSGACRDQ